MRFPAKITSICIWVAIPVVSFAAVIRVVKQRLCGFVDFTNGLPGDLKDLFLLSSQNCIAKSGAIDVNHVFWLLNQISVEII